MNIQSNFEIRPARVEDVPVILGLIRELATYERAPDEVTATEERLVDVLFGEKPVAEVLLAFEGKSPVGFAVFFHNFSTFIRKARQARKGLWPRVTCRSCQGCPRSRLRTDGMGGARLERTCD